MGSFFFLIISFYFLFCRLELRQKIDQQTVISEVSLVSIRQRERHAYMHHLSYLPTYQPVCSVRACVAVDVSLEQQGIKEQPTTVLKCELVCILLACAYIQYIR